MRLLLLAFALLGCQPASDHADSNELASEQTPAVSVGEFFECDKEVSNCRLVRSDVAPSPKILATWEITYDFPCTVGGAANDSTIELRVGSNHRRLVYGKRSQFVVLEGEGALTLVDSDPVMTSTWFFDYGKGCGLSLSYRVTPAPRQVSAWSDLAGSYTETLASNAKIYSYKASVSDWYEKHIQNPGQNASTIRQIIEALKAVAETDEIVKTYLKSLQDILDGVPKDAIFGPYAAARDALAKVLPKARALKDTMSKWQIPLKDSFQQAIGNAASAIGS